MIMFACMYNWLVYPHRLAAVRRFLPHGEAVILDVGCGNHSPKITKRYLPECEYHGLYNQRWNLDAEDDRCMDRLFELNLDEIAGLASVPDNAYDAVICSHILEHLQNPYEVTRALTTKLKSGGALYIEVPSPRSVKLPRACNGWFIFKGCLNFRDDETHRELVDIGRVVTEMRDRGLRVTGPRYRVMWRRVLLFPFYCAGCLFTKGFVPASVLWDITGFATTAIGVKGSA